MNVIKRNGKEVSFDVERIKRAITLANEKYQDLSEEKVLEVTSKVQKKCEKLNRNVQVEEIQDLVENELIKINAYRVAKHYIKYRYQKELERDRYSKLIEGIKEKLEARNITNQNANTDENSFGGRLNETNALLMKQYALDYCMCPQSKSNHLNNEIYIHDLDHYPLGDHNCAHEDSWVYISKNKDGKASYSYLQLKDLAKEIGLTPGHIAYLDNSNYLILSRDGWTKLNSVTSRETADGEITYTIKTKSGLPLKLTGKHRLPVLREGKEVLAEVKDLKVGDSLLNMENIYLNDKDYRETFLDLIGFSKKYNLDLRVVNLSRFKYYIRYTYGLDLTTYIRNNKSNSWLEKDGSLKLQEFVELIKKYPISYQLLGNLRVKINGGKRNYPLHIPFTPELAKLYAYIYADGGVYIDEDRDHPLHQLTFTNSNQEILGDFNRCYKSVFGYELKKHTSKNENGTEMVWLNDGSRFTTYLFRDFAGARKYNVNDISIPDFVLNGDEQIKYAYLSACIDTDGCLGSNKISYGSACKRYCEQLNLLLQSLGYHPHTSLVSKAGTKHKFGAKVVISNFDSYTTYISREEEKLKLYKNIDTVKRNDAYAYNGVSKHFNELQIVSITQDTDKHIVYDMETESHWYIINNYVSHNCMSMPIDKLLAEGFNTRQTDVRPSSGIHTALQLVAVLFQLQSLQQFGGVSATHLDWSMVPYVRKSYVRHYKHGLHYLENDPELTDEIRKRLDNPTEYSITDPVYSQFSKKVADYADEMTWKETYQAVEALYHNLNTLQSRSGCQLPFSSINYGTCTLEEGRMVIRALLEISIKGIGKLYRTSIFPCGIFQLMKGVNRAPGDPNYDLYRLALKSTSLRLYPNYANCDWSGNAGYDRNDPKTYFSTMGKRKLQLI